MAFLRYDLRWNSTIKALKISLCVVQAYTGTQTHINTHTHTKTAQKRSKAFFGQCQYNHTENKPYGFS